MKGHAFRILDASPGGPRDRLAVWAAAAAVRMGAPGSSLASSPSFPLTVPANPPRPGDFCRRGKMRVSPDEQWLVFSSRLVPAALSSRDFAEWEATSEARVLLTGAQTRPPRKQVSVSGVRDAPQSE